MRATKNIDETADRGHTTPSYLGREFITIQKAARYLAVSQSTLQNWITRKRFTEADGLRRFGGSTRIYFPTLEARALADELLKPQPAAD
jgi:excisionase family DNA binding protein